MLARATLLALGFAFAHLLGWREHTSLLSGTSAHGELGFRTSALLGIVYLGAWFAFLLGTPTLILAAAGLALAPKPAPASAPDPAPKNPDES